MRHPISLWAAERYANRASLQDEYAIWAVDENYCYFGQVIAQSSRCSGWSKNGNKQREAEETSSADILNGSSMNGINSNNNTAGRLLFIKGRRMHRMIAMETASVDQEILAGSSAEPLVSSKIAFLFIADLQ
jgi:predicted HicB family RNase H-like nuclease